MSDCIADGAVSADEIINAAISRVASLELQTGKRIDWLAELPHEGSHSARDVINAIGRALTKAGVVNNLERPADDQG